MTTVPVIEPVKTIPVIEPVKTVPGIEPVKIVPVIEPVKTVAVTGGLLDRLEEAHVSVLVESMSGQQ